MKCFNHRGIVIGILSPWSLLRIFACLPKPAPKRRNQTRRVLLYRRVFGVFFL